MIAAPLILAALLGAKGAPPPDPRARSADETAAICEIALEQARHGDRGWLERRMEADDLPAPERLRLVRECTVYFLGLTRPRP